MHEQKRQLNELPDIELMALRLENQAQLQMAQQNLNAIESETARRVGEYYKKLEKERPKDASIGKSPNGDDNQVAQEKVNEWLEAVKKKQEAQAQQEKDPESSASE